VPYLNIKRLGDGPLLAHTLDAARGSKYVDRVIVSTDDAHVAEVARAHGAEVPFLRPPELATDLPFTQARGRPRRARAGSGG
jgi:CMP-N-acetylneuraminic acid synthetase